MIHPSMTPTSKLFGQFTSALLSAEFHENATYYTFLFDYGPDAISVKMASCLTEQERNSDTLFSYDWENWDFIAQGSEYGSGTTAYNTPIAATVIALLEAGGFWDESLPSRLNKDATVMQAMTMSWAVDLLATEPNAYEYHFFDDEVWIYAGTRSLYISQAGADLDELYQLELRGGAGIETRYVDNHMDLAAETRRLIRGI